MPFRPIALIALSASTLLAQTQPPLMPWPSSISSAPGAVTIDTNFTVSLSGAGATDPRVTSYVERIFARLARQTGIPTLPHIAQAGSRSPAHPAASTPPIAPSDETATLRIVVEQKDHRSPQRLGDTERYSLEVSNGHARISADAPLGALRGIETFLQLVGQNANSPAGAPSSPGFSVPDLTIHDEPRFEWRGLSLDVSRHFIPTDEVKRTLDGMAAVKLNVLHWHLSDDQGFRVESKKYPRLQKYGSDEMYYTQEIAPPIRLAVMAVGTVLFVALSKIGWPV
jgi:hexosaminidase